MKEKTIAIWLFGILAGLLVVVFIGQKLLFNFGDNRFAASIENTIKYAKSGDWGNADKEALKVHKMWNNGNFLIAVKYAESDYTFLNVYLLRFDGAVKQRDMGEVEKEGAASLYIFNNITSIAPKP